ncbi:MAG: methane monooxygenase/ammonia monooxygenase subunit B [Proteobacteria bacterium]|nr:methane monooxygenase/ammonia monooxygenase subunit B [Pseudomonadota bacterium]
MKFFGINRLIGLILVLAILPLDSYAHGERAQQANTRMRTINWYDLEIGPKNVQVGEIVTVKGRFRASSQWPEEIPSIDDRVFLNVGTGGPNFVRLASNIDGVSGVQSTSLELGKDYSFETTLKARKPGRFHVHPILNVKDAGGMVGPGYWVEIGGSFEEFENSVETMLGRTVNLETFNLGSIAVWHIVWVVVGGAWLFYWIRQQPLLVPRMRKVDAAISRGDDPDSLITPTDLKVAIAFLTVTLLLIVGGFAWGEREAPITIPLRTAKTNMPADKPFPTSHVEAKVESATYRIPGRSFRMQLAVVNNGPATLQIGEFLVANVRFINPLVKTVTAIDEHDLVASEGLRIENGAIGPGQSKLIEVFAEDALWEIQRLTGMINDPDSIIAGLLFFYGDDGSREIVEIVGSMLPVFE